MADDGRGCDQSQVRLYVVGVTEPTPEPTNAELLAAMNEQAAAMMALTEMVRQGFAHAMTEVAGVKGDVAAVKNEVQRSEASITARVADVQNVVRTLKADLSGHVDDPGAHPHRHAA